MRNSRIFSPSQRNLKVLVRPGIFWANKLFRKKSSLGESALPVDLPGAAVLRPAAAEAELSLANAMGPLDAGYGDGRVVEGLEPRHRCAAPFDRSMILLNDVVQIRAGLRVDVAP